MNERKKKRENRNLLIILAQEENGKKISFYRKMTFLYCNF